MRAVRLLVLLLWLAVLAGASGFGPPTFGYGDPFSYRVSASDLAALRAVPPLPAGVRAAGTALVDPSTGHPLASRAADARLAPASLTKMMTALVALDRASLADTIRASERSLSEPVIIGLAPGDALPLEFMLYGLLLTSGNDAALAIAESVGGGSIERFIVWMNERAVAMGLSNTHFANPTGLDQTGHYSSARDMTEIARAVMAEPTLARIVATRRHTVDGPPLYLFVSTNPLLGTYPGVDGVKTGYTDDAGPSFAASAVRDGRRLVSVILNSSNIARETESLLDWAFALPPITLDVPRAGFAAVLDGSVANSSGRTAPLVGWERPFLRAFSTRTSTSIWLAGRRLVEWPR